MEQRALTHSEMTTDRCDWACYLNDYNFFGLQNGNECWCTNEFDADDVDDGVCDMECSDGYLVCGGDYSMDVYVVSTERST